MASRTSGTMMPADDEDAAVSTMTSGSITGASMPPANAVVAATVKAAASAIFFILSSRETPGLFNCLTPDLKG